MEMITSDENIKLAYRSIKGNSGSNTSGTDGKQSKMLNQYVNKHLLKLFGNACVITSRSQLSELKYPNRMAEQDH